MPSPHFKCEASNAGHAGGLRFAWLLSLLGKPAMFLSLGPNLAASSNHYCDDRGTGSEPPRMKKPHPEPMPPNLRNAFHDALAQYHDWRPGEDEPEVSLDRRAVKISDICNLVMIHDDPMPPRLVYLLGKETHADIDPPDWKEKSSYGIGARHLLKLINYRKDKDRRLEESRRK